MKTEYIINKMLKDLTLAAITMDSIRISDQKKL